MPTYDYLCPNGHRFEVLHSVTADGPAECPICQASPVRKAFSAPTIHFKGSGWAKKDRSTASRSASKAASAAAESGSSSDSGAGDHAAAASDKSNGSTGDASSSTDAKPATDRKTSSESGKTAGSSTSVGPAAAD